MACFRQRGFTIIFILLVLGLIGGSLIYLVWQIAQTPPTSPTSINSSPTPSPESTQTKNYYSKNLKFSIEIPSNFEIQEKFTSVVFKTKRDEITVSRNGTNFDNLEAHLDDLHKKNNSTLEKKQSLILNGLSSINGVLKFPGGPTEGQKVYYFYADNAIYILSTSSKSFYDELDQIAQSFRYTP